MDLQIQSNEAQGTPSEADVLEQAIRRILLTVHTSMPGIVQTWNASDGTADIQPCFMFKPVNFPPQAYPVIPHVPIVFYGPANGWVRFPVTKGDLVELHFQERALANWFASGGLVDPEERRIFHLTDAIAVPGLRSGAAPVVPKGDATSAEFAFGTAWLEITAAGKFKIKNGSGNELFSLLDQLLGALQSATVPAAPGSFDPGTLATIGTIKAGIDALKS
jgi:hypothetical protein